MTNMSSINLIFDKFFDENIYVEGFLRMNIKSLKKSYYIQYSPLRIEYTNKICELLGFENIHSYNQLAITNSTEKHFILIDDYLYPFINM